MLKENISREAYNKLYLIQSNYQVMSNNVNQKVTDRAKYIESNRAFVTYYSNNYYKTTENRSVAKTGVIRVYRGNDEIEDLYSSVWAIYSGSRRENNLQIVSNNGEKFSENARYSDSTINKSYSKFHGIKFYESPKKLLGDDGWIKVYNNDTNELIAAFNSSNWDSYIDNPFIYENDVPNIKILTSKLLNSMMFRIENIMNISDKEVVNEINKNNFDKLQIQVNLLVMEMLKLP